MTPKSPDPSEAGRNWASSEVAEQWSRRQARRDKIYGPATEMMFDLARISAGERVLDVAAATGDQTLLAARRVGPNGYVLAVDLSAAMLNVAAEAAREAGLTNIETRVMDSASLDLDAESFDVVICRLGLMLFSDPPKALREIHRVLKRRRKVRCARFLDSRKRTRIRKLLWQSFAGWEAQCHPSSRSANPACSRKPSDARWFPGYHRPSRRVSERCWA